MKIGDYVKVKNGIELDNGELINNWAGQITDIEGEFITIEKDAQTLDSLSDNYIRYGIENGLMEFIYVFEKSNLELSERRDTDELYQAAVSRYDARYQRIDNDTIIEVYEDVSEEDIEAFFEDIEDIEGAYLKAMKISIQTFLISPFATKIADVEAGLADFIIEMFYDYTWRYREEMMDEWTKETVDEVCLGILPRKVSMEAEEFEVVGKVLKYYFDFLVAEGFIHDEKLGDYVYSKRKAIYDNSQNPANWGMAKSLMMGAEKHGYDPTDKDSLNAYIASQGNRPFNIPDSYQPRYIEPAKRDPLKDIGRNDKVSVKYTNGKVVENVKFKKVMKDVKNGKCELI